MRDHVRWTSSTELPRRGAEIASSIATRFASPRKAHLRIGSMLQTARLPPWRSDKSASKSSRKASPWNAAPCSQVFHMHLPKSLTFAGIAIFMLCFQWVISNKNGFDVELRRCSGSRKISPLGPIAISLDVQWWPGRSRKLSPSASQCHRSTTGQSPQVGLFQPMSSLLPPNSLTFTVKTA